MLYNKNNYFKVILLVTLLGCNKGAEVESSEVNGRIQSETPYLHMVMIPPEEHHKSELERLKKENSNLFTNFIDGLGYFSDKLRSNLFKEAAENIPVCIYTGTTPDIERLSVTEKVFTASSIATDYPVRLSDLKGQFLWDGGINTIATGTSLFGCYKAAAAASAIIGAGTLGTGAIIAGGVSITACTAFGVLTLSRQGPLRTAMRRFDTAGHINNSTPVYRDYSHRNVYIDDVTRPNLSVHKPSVINTIVGNARRNQLSGEYKKTCRDYHRDMRTKFQNPDYVVTTDYYKPKPQYLKKSWADKGKRVPRLHTDPDMGKSVGVMKEGDVYKFIGKQTRDYIGKIILEVQKVKHPQKTTAGIREEILDNEKTYFIYARDVQGFELNLLTLKSFFRAKPSLFVSRIIGKEPKGAWLFSDRELKKPIKKMHRGDHFRRVTNSPIVLPNGKFVQEVQKVIAFYDKVDGLKVTVLEEGKKYFIDNEDLVHYEPFETDLSLPRR